MIKVKNLNFSFDNKILYKNLDFDIKNSSMTIITGLNGTGKTTLLKIISGEIKVKNCEINSDFKKIFFLPQKVSYPSGTTLFEYVISSFYSNSFKWYSSKEEKEKVTETLKMLGIIDCKDILLEKLSSGELQLANLAVALVSGFDCLLLDEPTSNLDLKNQVKILEILKSLTPKGISCVIITHDLNLTSKYGDYFIGISPNVVIQGKKEEFFTQNNLKNIFGLNFNVEFENEKIYLKIVDKHTGDF